MVFYLEVGNFRNNKNPFCPKKKLLRIFETAWGSSMRSKPCAFLVWFPWSPPLLPQKFEDLVGLATGLKTFDKKWGSFFHGTPNTCWVVVSNIFYNHPHLGKIPILTNILELGWNHHLAWKGDWTFSSPIFWGDVMKSLRGSTKIVGWKMDHLKFGDFAASRIFEGILFVHQSTSSLCIIQHYTLLYAWPEEKTSVCLCRGHFSLPILGRWSFIVIYA